MGGCFLSALVHLHLTLKLLVPTAVLPMCKCLLEINLKKPLKFNRGPECFSHVFEEAAI